MAKRTTKKADSLVHQTFPMTVMQNQRQVKELTDWKRAINAAESLAAPQRKTLYDLLLNVMLDTHTSAVVQKRILAVTNVSWSLTDKLGKPLEAFNGVLDSTFFEDILTYIIEARLYGHSLIQIDWQAQRVELIPRAHVNPRDKLVLPNPLLWGQGIAYNVPPYTNLVLEAGKPNDLGLLTKVAPYAIMKRNDISDWATFCEIFGMPMRVVYYDSSLPSNRTEAEKAMQDMGSAGYLVLPDGSRVEFPAAGGQGGTGNNTYDRFADFCNKEISKAIVGQTMTTEDGASLSQSQVHLKAEDRIAQNDLKYVERLLNEQLVPLMAAQGVTLPQDTRFQPVEEEQDIDKKTRLEMDLRIHAEVGRLPKAYFQQEYNVEFVNNSDQEPTPQPQKDEEQKTKNENQLEQTLFDRFVDFFARAGDPASPQVAPSALGAQIEHLYYHNCCGTTDEGVQLNDDQNQPIPPKPALDLKLLTQAALKNVYAGLAGQIEPATWEAATQTMIAAVENGMGFNYNAPNLPLALKLAQSGLWFAARRSYAQADELAQLLEKNGTKRSFSEFKKLATPIVDKYNVRWLETEYITAARSARMATIWEGMQRTAHLYPNVEYIRSRAATPRESHLKYVGIIRPLSDPWWHTHTPPLDWRCLCSVRPTNQPATTLPTNLPAPKAGLANNSAINQTLFSEDHPYAQNAKKVETELKKEFYDLRGKMGQYFKVKTPKGELVLVHPSHIENDVPENLPTAVELAEMGHKVELPPHTNKEKEKRPDLKIDGKLSDIKEPGSKKDSTPKNLVKSIQNAIGSANTQQVSIAVIRFDRALVKYTSEVILWGIYNAFLEGAKEINTKVREAWLIDLNGKIVKINRQQVINKDKAMKTQVEKMKWH